MPHREFDSYYFFIGGICSQWYYSPMMVDDRIFPTAEHWMMYNKAKLFGDEIAAHEIMSSDDPCNAKMIGRQVRSFDKGVWESVARDVVYKGNYHKFFGNEKLGKRLIRLSDKIIVESAPWDPIWGIGMSVDNPDVLDSDKWKGTNWLGQVLMKVRGDLKHRRPFDEFVDWSKEPNGV